MARRIPVALVLVIAVGLAGWLAWSARQQHGPVADADDAALVAAGRATYAARCAACHGDRLAGQAGWREGRQAAQPPAPALDAGGPAWHNPDRALFGIVKHGVATRGMPGFADALSDDDIWAVIAFLKSSWPAEIRAMHDRLNPS
jgi:S-disulfanyl-L-cysteine oxidoreductase SoxD